MPSRKRISSQEVAHLRKQKVVKSNELIQKRTHMLSVQEQKILLFLISQLKPDQKEFEYQTFDLIDFCDVCGIDHENGKNYINLRKAIKTLSDKSMWVIGNDTDTLMRWVTGAQIEKRNGKIKIRFDEEMKPFLLELKNRYTQFDLIYTLGMKSKYSVRLYEILKSYERTNEPVSFTLERFKELVGAEYGRWVDIKRRIIEPAIKEINRLSDLSVTYTTKTKGKGVIGVTFTLRPKRGFDEENETFRAIYRALDKEPIKRQVPGQLSLDGGEVDE
jgi:plasmid replication initiation protein